MPNKKIKLHFWVPPFAGLYSPDIVIVPACGDFQVYVDELVPRSVLEVDFLDGEPPRQTVFVAFRYTSPGFKGRQTPNLRDIRLRCLSGGPGGTTIVTVKEGQIANPVTEYHRVAG